jgi:hypothetical protein
MALSLREVRRDPIANRALKELMHHYTVAEEKSRLVLTKKAGNMKLFFYDLDDLHQWDFVHNQQMVKEIERWHVRSTTLDQQRESWKVRALMAGRAVRTTPGLPGAQRILQTQLEPRPPKSRCARRYSSRKEAARSRLLGQLEARATERAELISWVVMPGLARMLHNQYRSGP